jgi:hypothetical protein
MPTRAREELTLEACRVRNTAGKGVFEFDLEHCPNGCFWKQQFRISNDGKGSKAAVRELSASVAKT